MKSRNAEAIQKRRRRSTWGYGGRDGPDMKRYGLHAGERQAADKQTFNSCTVAHKKAQGGKFSLSVVVSASDNLLYGRSKENRLRVSISIWVAMVI